MNALSTTGVMLKDRENNIRIIRHVAAGSVIFSHAFVLNGGYQALINEPLEAMTTVSFAEIAVDVFFVTSGYLVTQSLISRQSLVAYLISRALRIFPALVAVAFLTAFMLGPLLTTLPLEKYFSTKSVYAYALYNSVILTPLRFRYELPGVFTTNPLSVVNGSLWTLPWEVWMYGALGALYLIRATKPWLILGVATLLLFVHSLLAFDIVAMSKLEVAGIRLATYFFVGAVFFLYRDGLRLTLVRQMVVTSTFIAATLFNRNDALLPIFLAHTVFFLAFYPPIVVRSMADGADFSYGIYLYAYPVQQILVMAFGPHNPYYNAMAALVLVIPLATLSWFFVEKPALDLKPAAIIRGEDLLLRFQAKLGRRQGDASPSASRKTLS